MVGGWHQSKINELLPTVVNDPTSSTAPAVEAGIDIKTLLRDTPPDLQHAMLMRYGARSADRLQ